MELLLKIKGSRWEAWLFALLLFDLPLVCMWIPSWPLAFIGCALLQGGISLWGATYFENLHENYRNEWLKKQIIISIVGIFIAYTLGYTHTMSTVDNYMALYFVFFVEHPIFNGFLYVFIYVLVDICICGLGYFIHAMMDLSINQGKA